MDVSSSTCQSPGPSACCTSGKTVPSVPVSWTKPTFVMIHVRPSGLVSTKPVCMMGLGSGSYFSSPNPRPQAVEPVHPQRFVGFNVGASPCFSGPSSQQRTTGPHSGYQELGAANLHNQKSSQKSVGSCCLHLSQGSFRTRNSEPSLEILGVQR